MKKLVIHLCLLIVASKINPVLAQAGRDFIYQNQRYYDYVKSIRLFPVNNAPYQDMQAPIVPLQRSESLLLHFDLLMDEYIDIQAQIIHCDADWTQSVLNDIEFLYDYNTFDIRDFEYSENTKELFVYYWMYMPRLKKTGNYIVKVYQNGDPKDVLLTRRFVVYENRVGIESRIGLSSMVRARSFNQQIDFDILFSRLNIANPLTDISVVIRQNQRWDNAIAGLKPTAVRLDRNMLEYRHFNSENNFQGGNEFRFFDLRTYTFAGQNVAHVNYRAEPMTSELMIDKSRKGKGYSRYNDHNGNYYIASLEPGASYLEADYIEVKFSLQSPNIDKSLYVIGAFNDWRKDPSTLMHYNAVASTYEIKLKLKQGFYNYLYSVDGKNTDPSQMEGSHYQTRNEYDIIVYYRSFGAMTDQVVGYSSFRTGF